MHRSSYLKMEYLVRYYERFFSKGKETIKILDIGSYDVNGTYKEIFKGPRYQYVGMDVAEGPNVDIVPQDIYSWKEIAEGSFDLVISGQVLEHVEYPWLTAKEIERVLKPSGFCILIAPNSGAEHKAPSDCYRYHSDGLSALAAWAGLKVHHVSVGGVPEVEDIWTWVSEWNDGCLVAQKGPAESGSLGEPFIQEVRVPFDDRELYQVWEDAIKQACGTFPNDNPLVLFGAGWIGDMALEILGSGNVSFFIDNDPSKAGKMHRGKEVLSFENFKGKKEGYNCLITASYATSLEIQKEFEEAGATCAVLRPAKRKATDKILPFLEDEESRFIYRKRLEYNETGEFGPIREITDKYLPELKGKPYYPGIEKEMLKLLEKRKKIALFGSGMNGRMVLNLLQGNKIEAVCFVDNDSSKWGTHVDGVEVKAPNSLDIHDTDCVVVTPYEQVFVDAILGQLKSLGAKDSSVLCYKDYCPVMLEQDQYFDPDIIKLQENEVFVDAGVLILGTSFRFIEECARSHVNNFKIFAFEPDNISYQRCRDIGKGIPDGNLQLYHAGLWSEDAKLYFEEMGNGASRITQRETNNFIRVVSLDNLALGKITFIKMDIEGAELEALKGSRETIKKYKPRLAISVYHKKEDITKIPLFIKKLVPEYKLYLRHYSNSDGETVLYAVV